MTIDDKASFPEKRRARRTPTPTGSTALLKFSSGPMDSVYISDISENGILIRDYPNKDELPIDSSISDIFVYIPPYERENTEAISLLLCNCKVVRSFFDKTSQTTCYGIEFQHTSIYAREKIESLENIHAQNIHPKID